MAILDIKWVKFCPCPYENPERFGGLENVTSVYIDMGMSNKRVKFQFWMNYLFEASPACRY